MSHSTSKLGNTFTWLGWIGGFALLALLFQQVIDDQTHPNRDIGSYVIDGFHQIELQRNRQGHYLLQGSINGQLVTFLVDTGATTTSIPAGLGDRLGLERGYAFDVSTANGRTRAYGTRLDSIKLGDIEFRGVSASLIPGFEGNEILLGMNILKHLELIQSGDQLIIRTPL
jgi:aspartyl protease family protein